MPEYRFEARRSVIFGYLGKHTHILVTGPHRAGTTITAAMIANDLSYEFQEDVQGQLESLADSSNVTPPTVYHCPSYCHYVHHLADIPGVAVVMVFRVIDDIIASEKRIPWAFEPQQLNYYRHKTTPKPAFAVQSPISQVKYRYWQEVQKPIFDQRKNGYELKYPDDLKRHPMWVAYDQRLEFTANQLEPGKPHGPRVQGRRFPGGIAGKVVREND